MLPSLGTANNAVPIFMLCVGKFSLYLCFGCDITLHGKVSPTDGKVLPRAVRDPRPYLLHQISLPSGDMDRNFRGTSSDYSVRHVAARDLYLKRMKRKKAGID